MGESVPDPADVAMATQLLARMNLRVEDLVDLDALVAGRAEAGGGGAVPVGRVPTFAEFVPVVSGAVPAPSRRVYGTYWRKIVAVWGGRRLDEITVSDVQGLFESVRAGVVVRRSGNGGQGAAEHTYNALLCLYRYAVEEEILTVRQNVMLRVGKPKRVRSRRHSLDPALVAKIQEIASTTGNDPELDALLLRFHIETAARRGGALGLRLRDLDAERCLVLLREKGATFRWQPVSPPLMASLLHHAHRRGAREQDSPVLRYLDGDPLTRKRYETLWGRIGKHVDTVHTRMISTHWLRHTTLTWVERNFGFAVARAYAGHVGPVSNTHGATYTYVKASLTEVATALQAMTGIRHPLAVTAHQEVEEHPLRAVLGVSGKL
ncbi:tyrosine-type recombinase/integrase [Saccharothrix isguenensis]